MASKYITMEQEYPLSVLVFLFESENRTILCRYEHCTHGDKRDKTNLIGTGTPSYYPVVSARLYWPWSRAD